MRKQGLYKYEYEGQVIYIGKSDANVAKRIADHKREAKFQPYLAKGVKVYTCILPNSTETKLVEQALINQYKPILNGTDNQKGFSNLIKIDEPNWVLFDEDAYRTELSNSNNKHSNPNSVLKPFPESLLDVPYMGIEKVTEGRKQHEEMLIAINGRTKIHGYEPAQIEDLKYPQYMYPTIQIAFYEEPDEDHFKTSKEDTFKWETRDYKTCTYEPSEVYRQLKEICEQVLLHDKNFGEKYVFKLSADRDCGLIRDLLNSSVELNLPRVSTLNMCIASEHHCFKTGTHEYHIPKSNLFDIYLALLMETPEQLNFDKLLDIYFKITLPWHVREHDIRTLLLVSGEHDAKHNVTVIERIRKQIGGEFREEIQERIQEESQEFVNDSYAKYRLKAEEYIVKARFIVVVDDCSYIICKGKKTLIKAVIRKWGTEQPPEILIPIEKRGCIEYNNNSFEYYPEIYLLHDDYKDWHSNALERGIPKINALKGLVWRNPDGIIELESWDEKIAGKSSVVVEACKAMFSEGF